jgi:hypothetical protein
LFSSSIDFVVNVFRSDGCSKRTQYLLGQALKVLLGAAKTLFSPYFSNKTTSVAKICTLETNLITLLKMGAKIR